MSFNQVECYRELYKRFEVSQHARFFTDLSWAENAEQTMAEFLSEHGSLLFQPWGELENEASAAQRALWNAIQRLRPGNVQFLLDEGVRLFPWPKSEDPFEIQWPYFNQNREAFLRTQEVLDAFDLPKVRVIV